jgi:hypothetical protein
LRPEAREPAQEGTPIPINVPVVDLHAGSCSNYVLEPEAEIADLHKQNYFRATDDLHDDLDGSFDDGILDDGEDLNGNGVLDVGFDANDDGLLQAGEIVTVDDGEAVAVIVNPPTVWQDEGEPDQDFDELFGEQKSILVHQSGIDYGTIIACGEVNAVDWEDQDQVVIGLRAIEGFGYYGYAVLERDTGNFPIFGENTTGVTVYLFQDLPSLRDERMMTAPTA